MITLDQGLEGDYGIQVITIILKNVIPTLCGMNYYVLGM